MNFNVGTVSKKGIPSLRSIICSQTKLPSPHTVSLLINQIIIKHEFSIHKVDYSSCLSLMPDN